MGELFASMEKMDIQAERRNTQLARQELAESRQELAESRRELAESRQELKKTSDKLNAFLEHLVSVCQNQGMSSERTLECLQTQYGLNAEEAFSAIQLFYDEK